MGWHHATPRKCLRHWVQGEAALLSLFPHIWWEEVWAEALDCLLHLLSPKTWGLDFQGTP